MARVVVITSGKGGVGKTTITCLLGRALADKGKKVVLIDADLGLKNLDVVLGLESRVIYDLEDVIKGRATLRQALVQDKISQSLYLLPACMRTDVSNINDGYLTSIVNQLQVDYDFILIDSPAGIEKGFINAIKNAKEAIVVLTLDKTSLRDGDKVVGLLKNSQINDIKMIVNRDKKNSNSQLKIADVMRIMDVSLLGVVEENRSIQLQQNYGLVLDKKSDTFIEFQNIANRMLGIDEVVKKNSFMTRFIKSISRS